MVSGLPYIQMPNEVHGTCVMSKKHREALPMAKSPLELTYLELFGPLEVSFHQC